VKIHHSRTDGAILDGSASPTTGTARHPGGPAPQAYPLGGSAIEEERLIRQAMDYEPRARALLDRVGVASGWTVADIGCGPLGILHLLSERVGARGRVVGLEREGRFAARARAEALARGLTNVEIIEGDARAIALPKAAFDLVHERLVLVNVAARERMLTEMMALLRPGGRLILEEVDNVSWICHPAHPSWGAVLDAFHEVFQSNGGDPFIGRRLAELLRVTGAHDIEVATDVEIVRPGEYRRMHLVSLLDSVRAAVLAKGLLDRDELDRHRDALVAHLADPATLLIDKLRVQAWGRKPGPGST
jgi:ubiquinone/menaquinone biosynthesis C-methylase UbiE